MRVWPQEGVATMWMRVVMTGDDMEGVVISLEGVVMDKELK